MTKDDHALYTSLAWTAEGDDILVSRQGQRPFGAFEGDTLDRVSPDRKPLPALWWWDEKSAR